MIRFANTAPQVTMPHSPKKSPRPQRVPMSQAKQIQPVVRRIDFASPVPKSSSSSSSNAGSSISQEDHDSVQLPTRCHSLLFCFVRFFLFFLVCCVCWYHPSTHPNIFFITGPRRKTRFAWWSELLITRSQQTDTSWHGSSGRVIRMTMTRGRSWHR